MEAIQATPQTIQEIFSKIYHIPEYQRPYSWEREHCEKLWEDLQSFVDSEPKASDKYFLGNIVLYEEDGKYCVVDGQQRLITLSLLMRAVFEKVMTYDKLERCLFVFDDVEGNNTGDIRIVSHVIDEESESLKKVLVDHDLGEATLYSRNYKVFYDLIDRLVNSFGVDKIKLKIFINLLLNNVVLLPIRCGALDDALTIFETINNRGLSLSDTDIFKAKLHRNAASKHREFIKRWNDISNDYNDIFRVYMYILRAKDQITDKEIGLRSFFLASDRPRLNEWEKSIADIERIDACINYHEADCPDVESCVICPKNVLCKWFHVLCYYPNQYWQYPIYTFLFKCLDDKWQLPSGKIAEYSELLKNTVRYCYVKSVVYNSVNVIKDTIFRVGVKLWKQEEYVDLYVENLKTDREMIVQSLKAGKFQRSLRGICFLHAYIDD
ncbi:MAG: DUF262 domain-containing protein, partial [Desulfovibrionaceae bacterium]|nr:DUF262 domain-containing protein [Desulfovibrionaceae bacterium]